MQQIVLECLHSLLYFSEIHFYILNVEYLSHVVTPVQDCNARARTRTVFTGLAWNEVLESELAHNWLRLDSESDPDSSRVYKTKISLVSLEDTFLLLHNIIHEWLHSQLTYRVFQTMKFDS